MPPLAGLLDDRRVTVTVADVLHLVPALPTGSLDLLLLDVDNGPGFLIHPANAGVYRRDFLAAAVTALAPGGVLGVWSADPAPQLADELTAACGWVDAVPLDVERDGRAFTYTVYLAGRPSAAPA